MNDTTRHESDAIESIERGPVAAGEAATEILRRLRERPGAFDLFHALRRVEAAHPHLPRLGDATRPQDEPVRFAQDAALDFAPTAISRLEDGASGPPRLVQRVFGFLGPNGALPIHLTEYARERRLHHNDPTFLRFLDALLHRFGLLFYKAWARAHPVVSLDRRDNLFVRELGSLLGIGEPAMRDADALGDVPKFHFAGRLSRAVRDADGLESWLALRFRLPVRVEQFVGHWMRLDRSERTRLAPAGHAVLGRGAVLGASVWDVQHKFRIVVGPLDWERYAHLLPGGEPLRQLQAMVRQYVGLEFDWDLRLVLRRDQVPRWPLGRDRQRGVGQLGRSAWLQGGPAYRRTRDADDLVMNVESILPWRAPARAGAA